MLFKHSTTIKNEKKEKVLINTAKLSVSVLFCGSLLIVLSYIIDIIFSKSSVLSLGEGTSFASAVYDTGSLINKATLPFITMLIAVAVGGTYAIPSGIIGGLICVSGSTAQNISGSITGVSGILGCVAAGYLSGYITKLTSKMLTKSEALLKTQIIYPAASLLFTIFTFFAVNSISSYIFTASSRLLAMAGEKESILLPLLLGILLTADAGGPLLLSAYIFGASSVATNQPQVMAAVIGAGMIPSLSIGLFAFVFKDRLEPFERITAYCGVLSGLVGLPQLAYPVYISRLYRFILPCIPGGCITALLSMAFKCSTLYPMGGLLTFSSEGRPLFFLVAIICGVLVSTALLTLTIKPLPEKERNDTSPKAVTATTKA